MTAVDPLIPSVADARDAYESHADVMAMYRPNGSRSLCRADIYRYACINAEAASVALDMANAHGRRWSAPTWLEPVAWA